MKTSHKVIGYQLLGTFQTNSPILTSEEEIRKMVSPTYAKALFGFVIELRM